MQHEDEVVQRFLDAYDEAASRTYAKNVTWLDQDKSVAREERVEAIAHDPGRGSVAIEPTLQICDAMERAFRRCHLLKEFTIDQSCDIQGRCGDLIKEAKRAFEAIPCVQHRVRISMPDLEEGNVGLEITVNGWTRRFRLEEFVLTRKNLTKEIQETFGSG